MNKLTDDYFDYLKNYQNEYGERVCILMQIGSFYEMQMVKNEQETIGNLDVISEILNIQMTKKNKSILKVDRSNPYMGGFPTPSLEKFLPILLQNDWTVVVIDQYGDAGKIRRKVSNIYSPSIQPLENTNYTNAKSRDDNNSLTTILIEIISDGVISWCISNINMITNVFYLHENTKNIKEYGTSSSGSNLNTLLDELYSILIKYSSKEILIYINKNWNIDKTKTETVTIPNELSLDYVCKYLNLDENKIKYKCCDSKTTERIKEISKIDYANEYLRRVYSHIDFGLLQPIEYFDLEKTIMCIPCIILTIDFISRHDIKYIRGISTPQLITEFDYLSLEMNTLHQLSLISGNENDNNKNKSNNSLFDIINKTNTSIGKRGLKYLLCRPLKSPQQIQYRYDFTEFLETLIGNESAVIIKLLSEIYDFEKLHRKMSLLVLRPFEFWNLHKSYISILKIDEMIKKFSDKFSFKKQNELQKYISDYTDTFDLEKLGECNFNSSDFISYPFKTGKFPELEKLLEQIKKEEDSIELLRQKYIGYIGVKKSGIDDQIRLNYTETEGYFFVCTKIRGQLIERNNKENDLVIKCTKNSCKITSKTLDKISENLTRLRENYTNKIKEIYINCLDDYWIQYRVLFEDLKTFVEIIDICISNILCKREYNYCKPIIDNQYNSEAYFNAEELRHPIIEIIRHDTQYIPNDVKLIPGSNGMVLYGLNSCGKSSLLRSVGISIVMAQCGLYVPCKNFVYYPFENIITQVDLYDNLWKSQSSFITEMVGLRNIMRNSTPNSLILSDELTKGTEVISATTLFAASVLKLLELGSKFIFTTHLGEVANLSKIKSKNNLNICHLSVRTNNETGEIIFDRRLHPGPCDSLYGLEVAKGIGLNDDLMETAFDLRDELLSRPKEILRSSRSKYNQKKIVSNCEICKYTPVKPTDLPLDVHHIQFQCQADDNKFIEHYHKNRKFNLVTLCKNCHIRVHRDEIKIIGWQQTTSGVKLDFDYVTN